MGCCIVRNGAAAGCLPASTRAASLANGSRAQPAGGDHSISDCRGDTHLDGLPHCLRDRYRHPDSYPNRYHHAYP